MLRKCEHQLFLWEICDGHEGKFQYLFLYQLFKRDLYLQIWWHLCKSLVERKKSCWIHVSMRWKLKHSQIRGQKQVPDKRTLKLSGRLYVILCRSIVSALSGFTVCSDLVLPEKDRWHQYLYSQQDLYENAECHPISWNFECENKVKTYPDLIPKIINPTIRMLEIEKTYEYS